LDRSLLLAGAETGDRRVEGTEQGVDAHLHDCISIGT
jgi:hypothetical protein